MVETSLLHELMLIINAGSTWVTAVDDSLYRVVYVCEPYGMVPYSCKNLVLQTSIRTGQYRCGHEWYLPEFRLQRSKQKVSPGKSASLLSMKEVEEIVKDASDGEIELRLIDSMI